MTDLGKSFEVSLRISSLHHPLPSIEGKLIIHDELLPSSSLAHSFKDRQVSSLESLDALIGKKRELFGFILFLMDMKR